MDTLFIFGAKYLWIASVIIALYALSRSDRRIEIIKFGILSLPLAYLFGILAKTLYYNPRPFVVGEFEPLIQHAADNGFPSDHVLLVAAMACLFKFFDHRVALSLWIIAILVAVSRVYVGVHHPLDVVASIVISLAVAWMVYFLGKIKPNASDSTSAA